MATKQARGTKRTCQNCDERFYDLGHDPIICPFCGTKYVIASSPAALAALQAEQRELAAKKAKKAAVVEEADGELPAVEGEEALVDVEADEAAGGMDRFHIAGWRRWALVEPISEGLTLGTGGLVLMLALAIPAFRETAEEDWLKASQLAVTFLDRYGNEIGSRGIRHNDAIPLDEFPDHLIKATLATEDRRFYDHWGIDSDRHDAGA